jgi:DNA-binding CsgD family transcriptional regulator
MTIDHDPAVETRLTPRERQCLCGVAAGLSAKELARELDISHRTVERHLDQARNKLGARNRVHMAAIAAGLGLTSPETRAEFKKISQIRDYVSNGPNGVNKYVVRTPDSAKLII